MGKHGSCAIFMSLVVTISSCHQQADTANAQEEVTDSTKEERQERSRYRAPLFFDYYFNDTIAEQIAINVQKHEMYPDSEQYRIIQTGDVRWGINIHSDRVVLFTSVQPYDPEMRPIIDYFTSLYGEPEDVWGDSTDFRWASSGIDDFHAPGSMHVRLRRVHDEEGGSFLWYY